MAIGDTVQAGLLRADFSPIERGGAAKGRAYRAIGEGIGSALDKFAKNKQEGEAAEMGINAMIAGMDDKQKEELLSGETKLGKTYNKFLDGELSNSQKKAFLGGLATYNTTYRQNMADQMARDKFEIAQADERRKADLYQRGLDDYKQNQIKAQIYDKFLGSREMVDMPVGGFDPNPLMRGVPQSTVRVPQGEYKGNRFFQTEQGKSDFTSLVDAGIDASDALEIASKREADLLASQPKAPDPFKAKQYFDESINKMRKEYNSLDEVKAFKPVRAAFLKVRQAAEKPSAAGDLALVFNYMKILDPGSVVREGEFKTAADATAWLQKSEADGVAIPAPIAQAIRKLKDGTILTDAQRKDFVNIARKAASAQFAPVKDSYLQYRNIVNQMQLPESLTLPDNYQMIEDELAGPISIESSSNAIKTDQGDYTLEGLSVEAQ